MIRFAVPADAEQILEIYAPIITDTAISFEYDVPSVSDFRARMEKILSFYPYLVWEENGKIQGFTYATRFRDRKAYDWICESAIYIRESARSNGIGFKLYSKLFECLRAQNMISVVGGIRSGSWSAMWHESLGFKSVGMVPYSGFKHDEWHDVEFWQLTLQNPVPKTPLAIIPFPKISSAISLND